MLNEMKKLFFNFFFSGDFLSVWNNYLPFKIQNFNRTYAPGISPVYTPLRGAKFKIIFISCLCIASLKAQDVHFSQFYMSPLTQNPALAGAQNDVQAIANYKNQWSSIAAPYTTMAASYDMRLTSAKSQRGFWAAGINVYDDKSGDEQLSLLQANLSVAYHIRLDGYNTLGAGFQGGFAQHSISYGGLQWGNQYNGSVYDPALPTGEPGGGGVARNYLDAGAGVVWVYNNTSGREKVTDNHDFTMNIGASVFHPQQPDYSLYNDGEVLYRKFVIHGDARISIPRTSVAIVPGFMFTRQGNTQEIYAGSQLRLKFKQESKVTGINKLSALSFGAYYRAADALTAVLMLEFAKFSVGMSYDLNLSPLQAASDLRGGLEVTLRYTAPNPNLKIFKSFFHPASQVQ
jgi:type IX secretion system PorP/SprF family membrane protein